ANTPAAATIYISAVWKPTSSANYGQFIVPMNINTAIVNGATEYQTLTGLGNTQSATESSFQQTVSAPSGLKFTNISIYVTTGITSNSGTTLEWSLRDNAGNPANAPNCAITGPANNTNMTCIGTAASGAAISDGDKLDTLQARSATVSTPNIAVSYLGYLVPPAGGGH